MNTLGLASLIVLWVVVLFLGFLVVGLLRNLGLLSWRLEQLEAVTPRRLGRDGLKRGTRAPDFTLPGVEGKEIALHDYAGRKVLLVFTQAGCAPCHAIVPELNRLQRQGDVQVLVVNHGDREAGAPWGPAVQARFPVLLQRDWQVSRRYQVFATPFAFLVDEQGVITSKGVINNRQHIQFLLAGARSGARNGHGRDDPAGADDAASSGPAGEAAKESSHD
jgi:methylamine dehydrogenase accessory protein MauD